MFMATVSTLVATLIIGINTNSLVIRRVPPWLKNVSPQGYATVAYTSHEFRAFFKLTINWLAKIAFKNETAFAQFGSNQAQR
jgi:hypothetical protein